ncbi:nitrate reductase subunit beta [Kibdelosporangium aridum]|uniref:Nitrate reductase subunit beta n=1 Tax=Kibdelosporangium aridum TaxID=2030 RepID=A0A428ZDA8_KIBAR|nr:nitrate reductase subunit beta [Kibdelosporangium aridum]RSM86063.1 nitrate reductase subunit beta [Kibdelosporangium aridum]
MRVLAQMAMVMNLDKCIGCHTCSVTCKQAWTNRPGAEYAWFNNVETRPGQGFPRTYEDQERWRGGWTLNRRGRLTLKAGRRLRRLLRIFANPRLPALRDYYEPWTYDYQNLMSAPSGEDIPTARPVSLTDGEPATITWSANWDDNLGGGPELAVHDPVLRTMSERIKLEFAQTFMFYLPRICEHCLNPSCVASCPSGAIYKRAEDGIVLVDSNTCRSWRMCVTGCPYKKVFLNHRTGKAEKCTFCFPRIEQGIPTVCAQTCVGRLRYIGVVLYDADRVLAAASEPDERALFEAQKQVLLDPDDDEVRHAAAQSGISPDWIEAAQRSPVRRLIFDFGLALPLHPEYRTLPMVWYIPPLSPVVDALRDTGFDGEDAANLFAAVDALRIPVGYLASLFTAGDPEPVRNVLCRMAAMRAYMRDITLGGTANESIPASVGMTGQQMRDMYRLLAIAKADDRYVIPRGHAEPSDVHDEGCSLDVAGGPGMSNGRVDLFTWDGKSRPAGLFRERDAT